MVSMRNKCSTLINEVVLNGKRMVVICGIVVGMGNMDCGCCKKLFGSGTNNWGGEPNNEEWLIDTVTKDACIFKRGDGSSHKVKDGERLVIEATVTGGVDENQEQVIGPIRIKSTAILSLSGNLCYGKINIKVLSGGNCAVLFNGHVIDPVTCEKLNIFNEDVRDGATSARISYKVVGFFEGN